MIINISIAELLIQISFLFIKFCVNQIVMTGTNVTAWRGLSLSHPDSCQYTHTGADHTESDSNVCTHRHG